LVGLDFGERREDNWLSYISAFDGFCDFKMLINSWQRFKVDLEGFFWKVLAVLSFFL
jgi:hypothetical protein